MKTNHRRKNKAKWGHNYDYMYAVKRMRAGLLPDYERGHKHAAEEIREIKTIRRRQERRRLNKLVDAEVNVQNNMNHYRSYQT